MAKKKSKKRTKSRSGSIDQAACAVAAAITADSISSPDHGTTEQNKQSSSPKHTPHESAKTTPSKPHVNNPTEEDLSIIREDEQTVLTAIYGPDFTLEAGAWNQPLYKLRIRPASDVTDMGGNNTEPRHNEQNPHNPHDEDQLRSCELTLHIQLNQKYPYSLPLIQITNAVSVHSKEISELLTMLQTKARECADVGAPMGWEMGQIVETYLVDCVDRRKHEMQKRKEDMKKKVLDFEDDDIERRLSIDEGYNGLLSDSDADATNPDELVQRMDSDTQRELNRQMEAIGTADRRRRQRRQQARDGILSVIEDKDEEDDESEGDNLLQLPEEYDLGSDDFAPADFVTTHTEDNALDQGGNNNSRYQADFIEMAHLGEGGGGEVVQARNRLDRRVYAIKKIILDPELDGHNTAATNIWAAAQNEKLRREVTTISQMQHKNIVRYYQAWVEQPGSDQDEGGPDSKEVVEDSINNEVHSADASEDDDSSTSSWGSLSSGSSSSGSSSSSQSGNEPFRRQSTEPFNNYSRSISLDNFLEHEVDDFANPLMFGNGALLGHRPMGTSANILSLHQQDESPSISHSISDWESNLRKRQSESYCILYIQMEFCHTTMRDVIDKEELCIDTVYRSIRQILEALAYIHSRNIIHRDLKPAK